MGTVSDKLTRLAATKADIKAALVEQGAVPSDVFSSYGDEIRNLPVEPVSVGPKEVNFYDYDGTILYAYTVEEMMAMTELPPLPKRTGLICQGWNWTLEGLQNYPRPMNVGAMYITDDGKTRLYIRISSEERMNVTLYFSQTVANGVTIDWGDGSETETLAGTGTVNSSHGYLAAGDYTITMDPVVGCAMTLGSGLPANGVLGDTTAYAYCNMLRKVEFGRNVTDIGPYAFWYSSSLESVTLPSGISRISSGVFGYCFSLSNVVIPSGVTTINGDALRECYALASVSLPEGAMVFGGTGFYRCYTLNSATLPDSVTSIGGATFSACRAMVSIAIPPGVTSILANTFSLCSSMVLFDFSRHTAVPTLVNVNAFTGIPADCEIRVPAALLDEWKAATNWATYADQIVGV